MSKKRLLELTAEEHDLLLSMLAHTYVYLCDLIDEYTEEQDEENKLYVVSELKQLRELYGKVDDIK